MGELITKAECRERDSECVDITAITKLKHAALWSAAKKLGGQSALARYLGIQPTELGEWINLKRCPPAEPIGKRWTEEFLTVMEGKLAVLTGLTWDELFPVALRENAAFLDCSKTLERTASVRCEALTSYAISTGERLQRIAMGWDGEAPPEDRTAAISRCLKSMSQSERMVIKLRYGIDQPDSLGRSLYEVAKILRMSVERVRQIEDRAVRRLQKPDLAAELIDYAQ